ncbi:MAG: DUF87 domain-containing protein [Planctomycetota bacterium]
MPHPATNLYEKLGAFYLGKTYDPDASRITDELLLYKAADLTTHAVCVGMTGSGKTGLCVGLLEEAAIDGVPALVIDPKGDIANMLLTFPGLKPADFRPWIDEQAAARKGATPDEYAASRADLWRKGLADWGQSGERIQRLRDAADLAIYTPGSSAGLPLRVLRSFESPPPAVLHDADALRERISSTVAGVLGLLGVDADPVTSREHMLLSMILDHAWRAGRDLDFASLIAEVQTPPFDKVGVLELDSVLPPKARFDLAMRLNTLIASPTFNAWTQGDPMDINALLSTPQGKPRVSILSIAHLSESERMFFVTVLLNEFVSWVRSQSGTSSLRALLYMDEVFGYFPPVAEPPSKRPMLTLMKQARAYGVGVVLATQNPVDLDYKGLSNAGTWFLGRLQTERDLARVLDGLEGASASASARFDRARIETLLAGLKSRVFLMHNVHDDGPTLFHTRWVMSYLRGPMTRDHIRTLMDPRKQAAADQAATPGTAPGPTKPAPAARVSKPPVPPGVEQRYLPPIETPGKGEQLVYAPAVLGSISLHYVRVAAKVDQWQDAALLAPLDDETSEDQAWSAAVRIDPEALDLIEDAEPDASYTDLPTWSLDPGQDAAWQRSLKSHAYRALAQPVWRCASLKIYSDLGEPRRDFAARARQLYREQRDQTLDKLRRKYQPKLEKLDDRIRKAEQRVEVETSQWRGAGLDSAVSIGASLLSSFFGGRRKSMSTAVNKANRAVRQRGDIGRAKENVQALIEERQALDARFEADIEATASLAFDPDKAITEIPVRPRKSDMTTRPTTLLWLPLAIKPDGSTRPLHDPLIAADSAAT